MQVPNSFDAMQLFPTLLQLAEKRRAEQAETQGYQGALEGFTELSPEQKNMLRGLGPTHGPAILNQFLSQSAAKKKQEEAQRERDLNMESQNLVADIDQSMFANQQTPIAPNLAGAEEEAAFQGQAPLSVQKRTDALRAEIDSRVGNMAQLKRQAIMRNPDAFKGMLSPEQFGGVLGFGKQGQEKPFQFEKQYIVDEMRKRGIPENEITDWLMGKGTSAAVQEMDRLRTLQKEFSTARGNKESFPEEQFIALQKLAPASEHPRLREEWLHHQNEIGAATPQQEQELKNTVDKRELALGDVHREQVQNEDGTTSTYVYNKLDFQRNGRSAKPIATFKGSPRNLEQSVVSEIQKKYLDSNILVKNLNDVEKYVRPDYLQYVGRSQNEIYNILVKAGYNDKQANDYVRNFQRFNGSVSRAFNVYRRLITGQQAGEKELQKLEDAFINGKMSWPQFQGALETIRAEASNSQTTYNDAIKKGLPAPESSPGMTDRAKSLVNKFTGGQ